MSLSTAVILVWTTVLSALQDVCSSSMASSVTSLGIEGSSVVMVSGMSSSTGTVSQVSANDLSTVVVIPEVV
jgi:hypothetical protein